MWCVCKRRGGLGETRSGVACRCFRSHLPRPQNASCELRCMIKLREGIQLVSISGVNGTER